MRCVCKYDKRRDLQEVDQFGFVDLVKSANEGFVPHDLGDTSSSFDGVDVDPESIIGKPSDRFDAIRMQESLATGITEDLKKHAKKDVSSSKTDNE